MSSKTQTYHVHIDSRNRMLEIDLKEVWKYKDLIVMFTKKSFVVNYKQTILGPLWLFINPLVSSFMYMIVFGGIAGLGTDGIPQMLFYLFGTAFWGFFSNCLTSNSGTFVNNAALFGKVYFPRLTVPISNMCSAFVRLSIQMSLVLMLSIYYLVKGIVAPHWIWLMLVLIETIHLGMLGMGFGIIISSMTTKYRDLSVLVGFAVQLWMYMTPVVYPLSQLSSSILRKMMLLNPVTMPMEMLRWVILGEGTVDIKYLLLSWVVTIFVLMVGIVIFNKVEKTFMDTV